MQILPSKSSFFPGGGATYIAAPFFIQHRLNLVPGQVVPSAIKPAPASSQGSARFFCFSQRNNPSAIVIHDTLWFARKNPQKPFRRRVENNDQCPNLNPETCSQPHANYRPSGERQKTVVPGKVCGGRAQIGARCSSRWPFTRSDDPTNNTCM